MEFQNDFYASEDPSTGRIWVSSANFSLLRENGLWKAASPEPRDIRLNFYPILDTHRAVALFNIATKEAQERPELKRPFQLSPAF